MLGLQACATTPNAGGLVPCAEWIITLCFVNYKVWSFAYPPPQVIWCSQPWEGLHGITFRGMRGRNEENCKLCRGCLARACPFLSLIQGATIRRDEHSGAVVVARIMRGGAADRSGEWSLWNDGIPAWLSLWLSSPTSRVTFVGFALLWGFVDGILRVPRSIGI